MHEYDGWVWRESIGQTEISHDPIAPILKRQGLLTVGGSRPLGSVGFSRTQVFNFTRVGATEDQKKKNSSPTSD